jgi:glucokinase-like ROK family protein
MKLFFPLPLSSEQILSTILLSIAKVLSTSDLQKTNMLGIGVGMHGIVNFKTGMSIFAPAFNWHNINIKGIIAEKFHCSVIVDNDARVMVLAELLFGKRRNLKNFIFLNLGSGVGGGIVLNGKIFRGTKFAAGEFGHIKVKEFGIRCVCGNYGCLDTVASEAGLINDVVEKIHLGYETSILSVIKDNDLKKITFDIILAAAQNHDQLAIDALERLGRYVGTALANIINIFNPEAVIIGGTISRAWDYIRLPIQETTLSQSMKECSQGVQILKSSFEGTAGEIGAAALVIENLFH